MATPQMIPDVLVPQLRRSSPLETISGTGFRQTIQVILGEKDTILGFIVTRDEGGFCEITGSQMSRESIEHFFFERLSDAYPYFKDSGDKLPDV